jgi:hypothetical protein
MTCLYKIIPTPIRKIEGEMKAQLEDSFKGSIYIQCLRKRFEAGRAEPKAQLEDWFN